MPSTETLPKLALSVRQPWAWAIIHGGKDIENRTKAALRHGGFDPKKIAIHASKGMTRYEYERAYDVIKEITGHCPSPDELVRGGIIGVVTITRIVTESESPWFCGPVGLVLENPIPLEPVPVKGALGIFRWKRGGELQEPAAWMGRWGRLIPSNEKQQVTAEPEPLPLFPENTP